MKKLLFCLGIISLNLTASAEVTYYTTNDEQRTMLLGNGVLFFVTYEGLPLIAGNYKYSYIAVKFKPTVDGSYGLGISATNFPDPYLILYNKDFNSQSAHANYLEIAGRKPIIDHQANGVPSVSCPDPGCPTLSYSLSKDQEYILVAAGYRSDFSISPPITFYSNPAGTFSSAGGAPQTRIVCRTVRLTCRSPFESLNGVKDERVFDFGSTIVCERQPVTTLLRSNSNNLWGTNLNLRISAVGIQNFVKLQDLNLLSNMKNDLMGGKGWSFSSSGAYESVHASVSQNTINLRANYLGDNHSFSSFLNKNIDYNSKTIPIKTVNNSNFGGFVTYNPAGVEKGLEVKLGLAAGYGDLKISREAIEDVTEPGNGISPYQSLSSLISAKYKMDYKEKFSLEPYLGLSFNQNILSGYKEVTNPLVSYPLTFNQIDSENTILFSGIKSSYQYNNRLKIGVNFELNYDVNPKITPLIATGLNGLQPVNIKSSKRIRYLVGAKGLFDLSKSSALIFNCTLQDTPFEQRGHVIMELGYKISL